jgi:Transglutaminase-like superfamily
MDVRSVYRLAPLVRYDDYDGYGYLLDIRRGVLEELDEGDTCMLSAVLGSETRVEAIPSPSRQIKGEHPEAEVSAMLNRLESQGFLEFRTDNRPERIAGTEEICNETVHSFQPATLRQRIVGTGHMVLVLNELRQDRDGLYRAYQYIQKMKATMHILLSPEAALQVVREEYWWYRIVTGLLERRIAHLLGQVPGEEGLCMVKAFALCAYLLTRGVPASIVIGRPRYGTRSGFKLHVWVELNRRPLNEVPNIRDRYRVLSAFPEYS